jgi:hypothetical protein
MFIVTASDVLSSDGRYKSREEDATDDIRNAAHVLGVRLSSLLNLYGNRPKISSGYRTPAANKAAGGAKKSSHLEGRACDFSDKDGALAKWCVANENYLEQFGLWMENPTATVGWCHLQSRPAVQRIFAP